MADEAVKFRKVAPNGGPILRSAYLHLLQAKAQHREWCAQLVRGVRCEAAFRHRRRRPSDQRTINGIDHRQHLRRYSAGEIRADEHPGTMARRLLRRTAPAA